MNNRYFKYTPGLEPIAAAARTAQNNEELATICERLNVADKIYLGKVDLWLAKHALSAVYRTLKKFPALRRMMNYFGTLNGFLKLKEEIINQLNIFDPEIINCLTEEIEDFYTNCKDMFKNNNGLAVAFIIELAGYNISGIIINGKSFNQKDVLNNLIKNELIGFNPKNCNTIKSVIEHELGHMFDFLLSIKSSYELKKLLSKYTIDEIGKNLSQYSVLNNKIDKMEVIAEGWSEYCNNSNPREISYTIGKLIEKKYQIKFGNINK